MTEPDTARRAGSGKRVLFYFLAFFGTILIVDSAFVYTALRTHSGEVTEQAYEKGLAYNQTLEKAREQPQLSERARYDAPVFRWQLNNPDGTAVSGAAVNVTFLRPVAQGSDFTISLQETAPGLYEAKPVFSHKGLWTAKLDARWNNQQYQTTQDIIAR